MPGEPRSFAYSLSQSEDGWRWNVFDEDGTTVADGANFSRDGAQAAIDRLLISIPFSGVAVST